jgi:deoxyribose-phosphate aldolase
LDTTALARYIDHTLLAPLTTVADIERLCREAVTYQFRTVCVPPCYVKPAAGLLSPGPVDVCTVIGFPLGYTSTEAKLAESRKAISDGARELDVVMNSAWFKSGDFPSVAAELNCLVQVTRQAGLILKCIIETANLSVDEIKAACELCAEADVDFVKTSTGFAGPGASIESIQQMRRFLPASVQIKASGGIRTYEQAIYFIRAGASRLGTSSGIAILRQQQQSNASPY